MENYSKIIPKEDGPLIVENLPLLKDASGSEMEARPVMALCRCGKSAKKPFCDGSHEAAGFRSANDGSEIRNTPVEYAGETDGTDVTVSYTPVLCSHAGACSAAAAKIFNPGRTPWVTPENGPISELLDAIANCPSGALRLKVGAGAAQHMTDGDIEISVEKDGPYRVKNVSLAADFNGAEASRTKFVLCRCGQSKNKPFCDGTHYDVGWKS